MKKITKILSAIFAFLLIYTSCDLKEIETLTDDFQIKVSAQPVFNLKNIKISNLNKGESINQNISISFEGENADKIYTINGTKDFKVEEGFLTVGITKDYVVTKDNPISVSAIVSANGYITKSRTINFDGSEFSEDEIGLLERGNLPDYTVLESVSETLSNNETQSEISLSITSNINPEEVSEFNIPQNTSFFDEDDNLISGSSVEADFQTFDTEATDESYTTAADENPESSSIVNNEFPGGLSVDGDFQKSPNFKSFQKSQLDLPQSYLIPITNLGCYYLYVNGRRVYRFSNPMLVRNYIFSGAQNPNTGEAIKENDMVSVYFYNTTTRSREKLQDAFIKKDANGRFYVEFNAPKSGVYPVGFERSYNHSCSEINTIKFTNNGRKSFYWYYVANKYNPSRAIRYGWMYFNGEYDVNSENINYYNNSALKMLGDDMVLKIYHYSYDEGRFKNIYDKEISVCELNGQSINITNQDCFEDMGQIEFSIDCPDNTSYRLSQTYIYYKPQGSYWRWYGNVTDSKLDGGKSACLQLGTNYVFGFYYDGWKVTPPITKDEVEALKTKLDINAICDAIKDL